MSVERNRTKSAKSEATTKDNGVIQPGDCALWDFKRVRQQADIEAARAGRVTQDQLIWFSGGMARRTKVIGQPYLKYQLPRMRLVA